MVNGLTLSILLFSKFIQTKFGNDVRALKSKSELFDKLIFVNDLNYVNTGGSYDSIP